MPDVSTHENTLIGKKCLPCEGGVEPLTLKEAEKLLKETPEWMMKVGMVGIPTPHPEHIFRKFVFKNFKEAMLFVNKVAAVANTEDHHPDIAIHYNKVTLTLSTHANGGLSENDFIVAAKIDQL